MIWVNTAFGSAEDKKSNLFSAKDPALLEKIEYCLAEKIAHSRHVFYPSPSEDRDHGM
jgi:hypothetical protein